MSFTQQLTSDPKSPSNQVAIENVREILSLHDPLPGHLLHLSDDHKTRRPAKRFELEECSETVRTALHEIFYTDTYLPCTCLGKGEVVCLSKDYVCALRLDGDLHLPGDDNHSFFDSVITRSNDENYQWTPVQFQLPKSVDADEESASYS